MAMTSLGIILPAAAVLMGAPYVINRDAIPPHFGTEVKLEKLYKDGGRVVDSPQLSLAAADQACPRGSQMVRQETREEAGRVYLVWTLRCR